MARRLKSKAEAAAEIGFTIARLQYLISHGQCKASKIWFDRSLKNGWRWGIPQKEINRLKKNPSKFGPKRGSCRKSLRGK